MPGLSQVKADGSAYLQFGEKCYHEIVTVQAIALNDEDGQQ